MTKVILMKYGELALKRRNKPKFENKLIEDIKTRLNRVGVYAIEKSQSVIYVTPLNEHDFNKMYKILKNVFGIATLSAAYYSEKNIESIKSLSLKVINESIKDGAKTFKVSSKREDKNFEYNSILMNNLLGAHILDNFKDIKVDVNYPDVILYVEIRKKCFIHTKKEKGRCGLPLLSGSAGVLLSGGFDSPVATYMLMKRGVSVFAIHFYSFPYTSEKSKSKVIDICAKLSEYSDAIKLFVVNFTEIMILISKNSKEEYLTVLMRRQMMKIAERITLNNGGSALVTGENLGQVASQTIENLSVTNNATKLLVMRPLIGMEKDEIINYSKMIGTYDISKEPYQDCCTVFVPKHPKTNSKIEKVLKLEQDLYDNTNMLEKIEESIKNVEIIGDFEN